MSTKSTNIQTKKIPYYLLLGLLTLGASLLLSLLSFGGMYALIPLLPLAIGSFVLSGAYEGEIYLQNIKGALNKLLARDYLKRRLAQEYLLEVVAEDQETEADDYPQFFKDYAAQLAQLKAFDKENLDEDSQERKEEAEKKLRQMEAWFAYILFLDEKEEDKTFSPYVQSLREYLANHEQQVYRTKLKQRSTEFYLAGAWSILSGIFMGIGTTYLAVEAFMVIPFIAVIPFTFWPIFILPLACIAGAAYGMLTFNTITEMINNKTIQKWYTKLREGWKEGFTWRNVLLTGGSILLTLLAIALTICTAGTWWTIASNARPLFDVMSKLPRVVMGIINPIVTGISSLFFNLQNTAETIGVGEESCEDSKNIFQDFKEELTETYQRAQRTENRFQLFNPFRLLLKVVVLPLRIIFFIGHLVSIAVTTDRMPGIPEILAALTAFFSEGVEDWHYFGGHSHSHNHQESEEQEASEESESEEEDHEDDEDEHHHHEHAHCEHQHEPKKSAFKKAMEERLHPSHAHNHGNDIPTRILKWLLTPVYFLATLWDWGFSQHNAAKTDVARLGEQPRRVLSFAEAWDKQLGVVKACRIEAPALSTNVSSEWQREYAEFVENKYTLAGSASDSLRSETNPLSSESNPLSSESDSQEISSEPGELIAAPSVFEAKPQVKASAPSLSRLGISFFASQKTTDTKDNSRPQLDFFCDEKPIRVSPGPSMGSVGE